MKHHVLLTGEIGSGKSTALKRTLALLDLCAQGLQTYYPQARGEEGRELYLRAWGDTGQGVFLTRLPGCDLAQTARVFDEAGCALLERAKDADVIVIDEIGRLERDAAHYHAALAACLEGDIPVLAVVRKLKAPWADWIRSHPNATLIEVTQENREEVPEAAAALIRRGMGHSA